MFAIINAHTLTSLDSFSVLAHDSPTAATFSPRSDSCCNKRVYQDLSANVFEPKRIAESTEAVGTWQMGNSHREIIPLVGVYASKAESQSLGSDDRVERRATK